MLTTEPVFAKSCLRGAGCTDAGTEEEPQGNVGEMSVYFSEPAAHEATQSEQQGEVKQHAQAAKKKNASSVKPATASSAASLQNEASPKTSSGEVNKPTLPPEEPWYQTILGLLVSKADAAMLPPPPQVVMAGTAAQSGSAAAAGGAVAQANHDAAKALTHQMTRLSGPSIWQGQLQMAQSFLLMGALIQHHLKGEKEDLLTPEKLLEVAKKQGTVPSRVRYQWVEDEETGKLKAVGYHTSMESGCDQVRVRLLKHDFANNRYEFWEEGATGPTILWTPDNPGVELPTDTAHGEQPVISSAVPGFEIPEMDDVSILSTPIPEDKDFRDYILVFPENAFPPIYVYLSKNPFDPIWTRRRKITEIRNAYKHWEKHGHEFPEIKNAKQYVDAAHDFMNTPPDGTLTKIRDNGDELFYHPETNIFASRSKDNAPQTMFKPTDKMDYWNDQ